VSCRCDPVIIPDEGQAQVSESQRILGEELSADLPAWDEVRTQRDWSGLLIGNGASQAVWGRFAYQSLFEVARSATVANALTAEDQTIFGRLGTTNFESVLGALRTAGIIAEALHLDRGVVAERYVNIRRALIDAVNQVHVPWKQVPASTLSAIRKVLLNHRWVFSTNYDLLVYWAVMAESSRPKDMKDYFWGSLDEVPDFFGFSPWDVDVSEDVTKVIYLHGGLHLYELPHGTSAKRVATADQNLLEIFSDYAGVDPDVAPIPLFVAEGDANDKLQAIGNSDYLSFAYQMLRGYGRPLVVFGHSLSDTDTHIVNALGSFRQRALAISILPGSEEQIRQQKAAYFEALPNAVLSFFDATTHPLGSPELRIADKEDDRGSP
jgi:hypothetical protein